MNKSLREQIEEIIKPYVYEAGGRDEDIASVTDQILSLFQEEMKKVIGEMQVTKKGFAPTPFAAARNNLRSEQLKKVEGIK